MTMHNCIKCDHFEMIPMADRTPAFSKYVCPECDTTQYIYHSRLDPKTYSEESAPEEVINFFKDL